MKLARPTTSLCTGPALRMDARISLATWSLAWMVALCERSRRTEASRSSLSFSETPPIRSEAFSVSAMMRANSLLAPRCESTNTELPRTFRSLKASAWMETNRSARCWRAFWYRLRRAM